MVLFKSVISMAAACLKEEAGRKGQGPRKNLHVSRCNLTTHLAQLSSSVTCDLEVKILCWENRERLLLLKAFPSSGRRGACVLLLEINQRRWLGVFFKYFV